MPGYRKGLLGSTYNREYEEARWRNSSLAYRIFSVCVGVFFILLCVAIAFGTTMALLHAFKGN